MANTIAISITSNTAGLQRGIGQAKGQINGLNSPVKKATSNVLGLAKSFLLVGAGYKAFNFIKGAVSEASNLTETLNKTQAIFGKSTKGLVNWSKSAYKNMGLSQEAALGYTAQLGDMFMQLGANEKAAVKLSKANVQMAADLGSFNNLETADVLDRISAAYRGEYDSLQKVVPGINAKRVNEEALRMTHKKSAADLTQYDKALAVDYIIKKDGARATGDFAKTSDQMANSQKILSARTKDLQAKLGKALVPALTLAVSASIKVVNALIKMGPVFSAIGNFVSKHSTIFKALALILTAVFIPAMIVAGTTATVNGIKIVAAWLKAQVAAVKSAATQVAAHTRTAAAWLMSGLRATGTAALYAAAYAFMAAEAIKNAAIQVATQVQAAASWALSTAAMVVQKVAMAAISAATKAYTAVQWALNVAMAANPIGIVIAVIVALIAVVTIAYGRSSTFRAIIVKAWAMIKAATASLWSMIKSAFSKIIGMFKSAGDKAKALKDALAGAWNAAKSKTIAIWNGIKSAVTSKINEVIGRVRAIKGRIIGVFSGAGSWLYSAGTRILRGLLSGITSMIGLVKSKLQGLTSLIPSWKGPRQRDMKLLTPAGQMIMKSLISGFDKEEDHVKKALQNTTKMIASEWDKNTPSLAVNMAARAPRMDSADAYGHAVGATGNTYYVEVKLDSSLSEIEMGKKFKKAIRAAEKIGA